MHSLRSLWAACICWTVIVQILLGAAPAGPALGLQYLKPLPEPPGPSSRRSPIVLSEIQYHPAARSDGRRLQFIELFNSQVFFEDLSGWSLQGDIQFTFPTNTILPARSYFVVAENPTDLRAIYPDLNAVGAAAVFGPFDHQAALAHGSGNLRLLNRLGAVVFEVNYSATQQWPVAPDGGGPSLVLARPSYGERLAMAWGASELPGGSPGGPEPARIATPQDALVINEILANPVPPARDFVELFNYSDVPVDLSGCILTDDPSTNRFIIPAGTEIPARGQLAWNQDTLGFGLSSAGEQIFLYASNRVRVLDAIAFDAQETGVAWGRSPDGASQFSALQSPSPNQANAAPFRSPVVLNEIMYHPASELNDDQYVELYNHSTNAVDVSGWRLNSGIHFTFPPGAVIPADGYFVVARNLAALATNYPNYDPARWFGDFTGSLSGSGERLTLTKPVYSVQTPRAGVSVTNVLHVVVDEVTYGTGGRWGHWADGGGSSLERRDPRTDGRLAANWTDSDESSKSPWVTLQATGPADLGNTAADALQILTHGAGEYLIDDVLVQVGANTNRVINSTFDTGTTGWVFQGNHLYSSWEAQEGSGAPGCLRLKATGAGTTGPNRAYTRIVSVPTGSTVTLRARVRWLRGSPAILFRLKGSYQEIPGYALAARNLGTPGARNTARLSQSVPSITEVSHFPVVPRNSEVVRITARIGDLTGIDSVELRYHADSTTNFTSLPMTNSGAGWFAVNLPPLSGFQQFHIRVTNLAGQVTVFPDDAPDRECNIRYGDPLLAGALGQYRLWVSKTNVTRWTKRHALANDPLDTTFVYGTFRAIYNAGSQYSGSPYHSPGYNTPTGNACDYVVVVPPDDPFLGDTELNLLQPGNGGGDTTAQQEQQAYWIAGQIGVPYCNRRSVVMWFNGVKRGIVYEDAQQPNGDFVQQWYPNDAHGDLRKIQLWFEFEPDGSTFSPISATLDNFVSQGKKKLARYRWMWPRRSFGNDPNNFTNLFALVDAVNTREVTDRYTRVLEQATDVGQWFRTHVVEHLVGNNDSYSYGGGQNMYAYKPERGPWQLLIWDIDFAFASAPANSDMLGIGGANVGPLNSHPPFARKYYQAMIDCIQGPLDPNRYTPILDARYNGMRTNGAATVTAPTAIKSFLRDRRNYLIKLVNNNTAALAISPNFTNGITSGINLVTLSGTAPLEAQLLTLDGNVIPVTWTSRTVWTAKVPFPSGTNVVTLGGLDGQGLPLTNPPVTVRVIVTAPDESPVGKVVISEIMPQPASALAASWLELQNISFSAAFDLSGWRMEGLSYVFPSGTIIPAGGRLILPSSRYLFGQTYGPQLSVAPEFPGHLDTTGETLRLVKPGTAGGADQIIDELRYGTSSPWPETLPGTALQLIDSTQDNRRPLNWSTATRTGPSLDWQRVAATFPATSSTAYLYLENAGDAYIDDWFLSYGAEAEAGTNLLPGGDFEGTFPGTFQIGSNHQGSVVSTDFARSGTHSLRLVADGPGVTRASAIAVDLPLALTNGATYTLSFWYRPKSAGGLVTSRLSGSPVNATAALDFNLPLAGQPATPAAANTGARPLFAIPALALNEIMPENTATLRDNRGFYRPWVEIHNGADTEQSLADCFLSPTPDAASAWRFPAAAVVPAHGYLIVWLDGDSGASTPTSPHTSFAIGTTGTLILSQLSEQRLGTLDQINYADPGADRSFGDLPDGDLLRRRLLTTPTPRQANTQADPAAQVVINEWLADNTAVNADPADGNFDDWFELYNAGSTPVNLAGYFLSNSRSTPARFAIPAGYLLPAGGHLLVWADNDPAQNQPNQPHLHVDFKLSKAGDTIVFASPDGVILDAVTFGVQTRNVSQGREPDGGRAIGSYARPTPGQANPFPASPARVTAIVPFGTEVQLQFTGAPLRRYALEERADLTGQGAWQAATTVRTDTNGKAVLVTSPLPEAPTNFYRIIAVPGDF